MAQRLTRARTHARPCGPANTAYAYACVMTHRHCLLPLPLMSGPRLSSPTFPPLLYFFTQGREPRRQASEALPRILAVRLRAIGCKRMDGHHIHNPWLVILPQLAPCCADIAAMAPAP